MEQLLTSLFDSVGGAFSYLLVLGILLLCGVGLPVPEDVSLILGGSLVYQGKAQLFFMMVVGYVGIILGDSIMFALGRRFGSQVGVKQGGFLSRIITPAKRARVEELFKKHGEKVVMVARFLPGVRAPTYFTAGSVGMKYSHFLFFDSVAALASAPAFVYLGFRFGGELEYLLQQIRKGQRGVLLALAVLVVVGFFVSRWRSKREKRIEAEALKKQQEQQLERIEPARDSSSAL
ncbi:MAG: DedA family protein [Myxococcales bacterium]|nr:DedA family protein [Myxococcales bacterium]